MEVNWVQTTGSHHKAGANTRAPVENVGHDLVLNLLKPRTTEDLKDRQAACGLKPQATS